MPKDFKIPEFTKYDGITNPLLHLKTYCTKMAMSSKEEKFLVSFFHEGLTGPALEWYIQQEISKISCWKDLADAFMTKYRFNREQLRVLQKKDDESFKQYAQRWRSLAAQVQPPLTLSELCSYFVGTLETAYVGAMVGVTYRDFADLVAAGERIEMMMKSGKLPVNNVEKNQKKSFSQKKKESEVSYVQGQSYPRPFYPPRYSTPRPPSPFHSYPNPNT